MLFENFNGCFETLKLGKIFKFHISAAKSFIKLTTDAYSYNCLNILLRSLNFKIPAQTVILRGMGVCRFFGAKISSIIPWQ